ncbi:hypothetical protein AMELA_G00229110 [Ameiurus melas]|uniref:Uncharacterized protein n=1 Tax=Ameiurus melas TaxID=219545 RepID=A0A7J5ZWR2_AMEME|nr:hypothetical protein AMELA_G00229110 [Ameiurus melas]
MMDLEEERRLIKRNIQITNCFWACLPSRSILMRMINEDEGKNLPLTDLLKGAASLCDSLMTHPPRQGRMIDADSRPSFKELTEEFCSVAGGPQRNLVIQTEGDLLGGGCSFWQELITLQFFFFFFFAKNLPTLHNPPPSSSHPKEIFKLSLDDGCKCITSLLNKTLQGKLT